ncbi:hypothetical protein MUU72_22230 [Streptomyces sp. RS10V-4]|uniref:hypothetical protein n=1 Tax=Streptomyces rhizoryzae TaxID=2932493 RepID=UPI002002FE2F|nr:hypothetical protein [Streptomyces rhizoryzae]MCK7625786.1 hypothetical protein [Streptomyces rhizoryzae]
MYLIRLSADALHALHLDGGLVPALEAAEEAKVAQGRRNRSSKGEKEAWGTSLPAMARDLRDAGLGAVDMMVEYALPDVPAADVVLAGLHPATRAPSYVVAELKRWRRVTADPDCAGRFRVAKQIGKTKRHPAEQTAAFCRALITAQPALAEHEDRLTSLAYLHNAADGDVADLLRYPRTALSRVFTRDSRGALIRFLRQRLAPAPGRLVPDFFTEDPVPARLGGPDGPAARRHEADFRLASDPGAARRYVLDAVRAAYTAQEKTVLVLTGLPADRGEQLAAEAADALRRAGYPARLLSGPGPAALPACDVLFCAESWLRHAHSSPASGAGADPGDLLTTMIRAARVPVFVLAAARAEPADGADAGPLVRRAADALCLPCNHIRLDRDFR